MGMDIYSNSGVVFPVEDAAPAIFSKAKKNQIAQAVEAIKSKWNYNDKSGLDDVKDPDALIGWVVETANKFGQVANSQDGYIDSLALVSLFDILCDSFGIKLPSFSFEYWTRSRISGWEVPTNTPCIVFDNDGLFETKPTKEGKKLAKMLGQESIESTTWTIMSV